MSFLKIKDPVKREQTVKEYLATMKRIRDNQLAEKTGDIELQTDLSKFFKPITETQKVTTKEITEGLKPIKEGIEQLPKEFPQPAPPILEKEEDDHEKVGYSLLDEKYRDLQEEYEENIDKTFGIKRKNINYYIGNKLVDYDGDDLWVGAERYKPTEGLWELIMAKNPSRKHNFTNEDLKNYEKILIKSSVIFHDNDPIRRPKSSSGSKYNIFIKPIYEKIKERKGKGITIIPSDPNALLERLDLLMASKGAGHTGVRNELVSICDELKRQRILDTKTYKKLMALL